MLKIDGLNISGLPFEELTVISELLDFEYEPILTHSQDSNGDDWLCYWVDFNEDSKRWLYAKISRSELFYYLIGSKSLKDTFAEISSDYVFLVDLDIQGIITSIKLINSFAIPDTYFASANSFYRWGLPDFHKDYLSEFNYLHKLREKSYVVNVKSANVVHGTTVAAKEAAFVLSNATKSIEGYIDVTSFNLYKNKTGDRNKVNRKVNRIKEHLSPRITETAYGSFEVWLSMDVVTFIETEDKDETAWRDTLVENYKNDVLDVDITSPEDAEIIAEKFSEEERKKIFEPLFRIYDNDDIAVTISDYKKSFKRDTRRKPLTQEFRERIIPKPTIEELEAAQEKRKRLVHAVYLLDEGQDINTIKAKQRRQGLLFTEEDDIANFPLPSPLTIGDREIELVRPLKFVLSIDNQNVYHLVNAGLELSADHADLPQAIEDVKAQFAQLVEEYQANPEKADLRFEELKSILSRQAK